jgi:hypothetical protein
MPDLCVLLRNGARWMFLLALVYAPWAYGCTTAGAIRRLNILLAVVVVLWAFEKGTSYWFFAKRRGYWLSVRGYQGKSGEQRSDEGDPRVYGSRDKTRDNQERITDNPQPRWALLAPCVLLLLLGWWMTINARWVYDGDYFLFIPRSALIGRGPGSVDYSISLAWMIRATLLLGVVWIVAGLSRDPVWLVRLWWTIAIAGGSIALLGLIQKASGAPMIFWEATETPVKSFFATYYAHGNAGAYLNLVLPATIALALRSFLRKSAPLVRAVAIVLSLLVIVATISNTSRGGQGIGLLLVLLVPICLRDILFSGMRRTEKRTLLLAAGVVVFTLVAIAGASHLDQSLGRWHEVQSKVEGDNRWLASRAAWGAVGDAGCFGFGPGTFRVVFPYYTNGLGPKVAGVWHFLHEDYLQTLLEWGWIGSACWALLFFGGMWTGIRTLARRRSLSISGRQRLFLTSAVLALVGVALHAFVDFPFQIASLQLYVATYVGVCWGLRPEA